MLRRLALIGALAGIPLPGDCFSFPVRVAATEGARLAVDEVRIGGSPDGVLAAAWGSGQTNGPLTLAVSTDQGRSWELHAVPGLGLDPFVAASPDGRLDLVWRDSERVNGQRPMFHARTDDLGLTWSEPRQVGWIDSSWANGWDNTALAVSRTGVVAIAGHTGLASTSVLFLSDPEARSWVSVEAMDSQVMESQAIAWLSGSDLLLCYPARDEVRCRASSDGGRTFAPDVVATRAPGAELIEDGHVSLVVRGPGDVILGATAPGLVWVVRSADGGLTWSDATVLTETEGEWSRPSLAAHPGGEVWLTSRTAFDGYAPATETVARLWSTADGVSWREVAMPADFACLPLERPLVLAPAWRTPVLLSGPRSWTASATLGWEPARSIAPAHDPVSDLRLVETSSGRLVALWRHGRELPRPVLSSFSDDSGDTWSAPAAVSDGLTSLRAGGIPIGFDAIATPEGGVAVLWLERDAGGCSVVRLSLSPDGAAFEPSLRLGETSDSRLALAADRTGSLVAQWVDRDLLSARSVDGGRSWATPVAVLTPDKDDVSVLRPAGLARAADGSLVTVAADTDGFSHKLVGARSTDGGASWLAFDVMPISFGGVERLVLAAAGPRLFATGSAVCVFACLNATYVSEDSGQSWSEITPRVPAEPSLTGGGDGSLYWHAGGKVETRLADGTMRTIGPLPSGTAPPALVAFAPGDLGALHADASGAFGAPAVLYSRAGCAAVTIESSSPDQLVCDGSLSLSVTATGGPDLAYQWVHDGQPIPGAVAAEYSVVPVTPADAGSYVCVVMDGCNAVTAPAVVNLGEFPPPIGNVLSLRRSGTSLVASWQTVDGATFYSVYRGTDPAGDFPTLVRTVNGDSAQATFARPSGDLVFFRVAARNDCGLGPK